MGRTAASLKHLVVSLERGHAKVGNLDVALAIKQQVFGLQIPMADIEAMAVVDTSDSI